MAKTRNGGGSNPRITKRLSDLIDIVVQGQAKDADEAAKLSGLSRRSVYDALKRDHVRAEIERRGRQQLSGFAFPRALSTMADLLNSNSDYVKADIAKHIAAIHGVKPQTDAAPAGVGGFVYRLIINGQQIEIGALAVPSGTSDVQTIEHEP